jgi:GAF domain-containing protein
MTGELITDRGRLNLIGRIDLDDPRLRADLDRVAARTAARTGMPASMITIVLNSAQFFAGAAGLPPWLAGLGGTPLGWSLCADVVTTGRPYLVDDVGADPRHDTNPLFVNDLMAAYAGVPITVERHVLGAVCVIDSEPHPFSEGQMTELHRAAAEVEAVIMRHTSAD